MKSLSAFLIALGCLFSFAITDSFAKDVYIKGYYRRDGTYVSPHIRSAPNSYKWDNYGPSRNDSELMNPKSRDNDRDGTPNYLDRDDDNDSTPDDRDPHQYNR